MSYANLFYLRFLRGLSTLELERLFPGEKRKVCVVALCSLPDQTLASVLNERVFRQIQKIRESCFHRWGSSVI